MKFEQYHIAEAMIRWFAPILSFTADEAWSCLPGKHEGNVFTQHWYDALVELPEKFDMDHSFWVSVLDVREQISRELERLREAKEIGSSLNAEVDIYCSQELYDTLSLLGDELRFALITSYARLHLVTKQPGGATEQTLSDGKQFWIKAAASEHTKCVRCWHHRESVGKNPDHPELCERCIINIGPEGEDRRHA